MHNDSKLINPDTISYYVRTNEEDVKTPVKGVVLEFPGLSGDSCMGGTMEMEPYATKYATDFASKGILIAYLYTGPWNWGNKAAMRIANAVLDAIKEKFDLADNFALSLCGGSMGGLGSLMFAVNTRHKIKCVAAACPCVDVEASFDCSPDFPRTYIRAAAAYDMPLDEALKEFSPIHHISKLPDVPYYISSDGADELFPEELCNAYVEKLKARGLNVTYQKQPGLTHGRFIPEVRMAMHEFIVKNLID